MMTRCQQRAAYDSNMIATHSQAKHDLETVAFWNDSAPAFDHGQSASAFTQLSSVVG